jgi:2-dehydropantoate 2-reductase
MKIVVLGCGGIGGVIAACLTRAGHDVTPVTGNAQIAAAIATHGYRVLEIDGSSWSVPPKSTPLVAAGDAGDGAAARYDLCIVATQSTTLESALASVAPHLAENAVVVCCQNGLPEDRAATVVGSARVLGCVVGWGASMVEPGSYKRTSRGGLQLGRPRGDAPDPQPIAEILAPASEVRVVDDLAGVRWSKLAINCATSTLGAAGGQPLGKLLRHRFIRRLALEVFAEVAEVARKSGVKPAPVAGTFELERLAISPAERKQKIGSPSLAYKHTVLFAVGMKYRRMRSSMLYAIERGRPPEIDFLNGELVRRGAALGVPTPVNAALVETVRSIAGGEKKPSIETLRALADALPPTH